MNVKSLMLLLTLAGLGASCSDDETTGGGITGTTGRSELQIVVSGSGESQSYDKTKAIATSKETQIDDLQIYLFAAASENGPYYYLETWQEGTVYDPENPTTTNFKMSDAGSGHKASLYPNELPGVPYIKLFCVANKNVPGVLASDGATVSQTTDDKFYSEDGGSEILTSLTPVTTSANGDGTYDINPGTTEADFIASFTKALGAGPDGVISTPLLMTGQGKTKISGNVSIVKIDLTRVAARFDVDNTTSKSNLTIKKVTLAQGRKTAPLWGAPITAVDKANLGTSSLIAQKYEAVDFEKLTGANQGITESSIYVYPTLASDESYLILEGTYKSPVNSSQVAVTYHVPIVRTPKDAPEGTKGEPIAINANNRYCLRITDVTLSNVFGTFDVVDWTSAGGITIRPDNDSPVFNAKVAFDDASANKPTDLNATNPEATTYDYEVTGDAGGSGSFLLTMAATGTVRCEKETMSATKAGETDWLTITTNKTEERDGVWYTTFSFSYNNSIGKQPVAVHFINETASYDPALWTTVNFYGPKAVPEFALAAGGNSKGNQTNVDDPKAPTATIYSVNGSYVTFDITSIEGIEVGELTGYKVEKIASNGFVHTFKVSVSDQATAAGGDMTFMNAGDKTKVTKLAITKADPSLTVEKSTDANSASDYIAGSETPFVITGTLQVDLDLLSTGSCNFKVNSPQGLSVASQDCPWLSISEVHQWSANEPYNEYQLTKKTSQVFTDYDLVFTSKLTETNITAPGFTLTLNKAYSKPIFSASTVAKSDFNDAPEFSDAYAPTAQMYLVNGSKITIKATCPETISFLEKTTSGLTITNKNDGNYEIVVNDASQFSVGGTTEVIAQNTTTGAESRNAKLTITWLDPAITFEQDKSADPGGIEISGDNVNITYATMNQYTPVALKVKGYKGSTISYTNETGGWLVASGTLPTAIESDGTATILFTRNGATSTASDNITITITNAITGATDKTITLVKK